MAFHSLRQPRNLFITLAVLLGLSLLLAAASSQFSSIQDWPAFLINLSLAYLLLLAAWRMLRSAEPPRWLWWLLLGGALLRLALGVFWSVSLPAWGYDTPVQQAGYVMEDAFNRDEAAWTLSQSEGSLTEAFQGYSGRDQYGGLLFFSAAVYRGSGTSLHQPLLILIFTAAFSSFSIAFTWAFVRHFWGQGAARIAAWGLAIYPEALLLGSSQMREAFGITLIAGSLYALLLFAERRTWPAFAWLFLGPALAVPLSPPFALALLVLLALVALPAFEWRFFASPRIWLPTLLIVAAAAIFLFIQNGQWLVEAASWQTYVSRNASGWVARQFDKMPLWAQVPFLLSYGVVRPLLPAAVFADGALIWRGIAIWRALGWTLLLAMLLYATYLAFRTRSWLKFPGILLLVSWGYTLISSYRGGGDLWDNPRYRSTFAGIQIALAAWAWVQQQETKDPWLRRAIVGAGLMSLWWAPWYLRRYATFNWPIVEIQHVIGLGLASLVLYVIWDWVSA